MPIRLTVSPRNHKQGAVELKLRGEKDAVQVPYAEVARLVLETVGRLREEIEKVADAR